MQFGVFRVLGPLLGANVLPEPCIVAYSRGISASPTCDGVCCAAACGALYEEYLILAGKSWGTAGEKPAVKEQWAALNCNVGICDYWAAKYGVKPSVTWGSLPDAYKASWDWDRAVDGSGVGNCNENVSAEVTA
jgi:hypothetical protein